MEMRTVKERIKEWPMKELKKYFKVSIAWWEIVRRLEKK